MGECNLDKIEYAELYAETVPGTEGEGLSRQEILARNADIPWRSEIEGTGENGNIITSSSRRTEHIESKPTSKNLLNHFLTYYELLGKLEAS
jgi:hypothetical protein